MLGLLLVGIVVSLGGGAILNMYLLDGVAGVFWSLGFEEDTEYAPGYSDSAFRKIHKGMSRTEVLAILGPPLRTVDQGAGRESLAYSRSPRDKSYRERVVILENGKVFRIIQQFYVD
jgi:hypothetical protein